MQNCKNNTKLQKQLDNYELLGYNKGINKGDVIMPEKFQKSQMYPGASWSAAVNLIETINTKFGGSTVSYEELSRVYNVSPSTKSFTGRLSGAKQYGLIETLSGTISITNFGKSYLYPTTENSRNEIALEAIKKPKLFSDLIDRYNNKPLPTKELLSNVLMAEYSIMQNVKDSVANIFIDTIDQLGLRVNGILKYDTSNSNSLTKTISEFPDNRDDANQTQQLLQSVTPNKCIEIIFPTEPGIISKVVYSENATKEDLLGLRDMLDVVLKRRFKVSSDDL